MDGAAYAVARPNRENSKGHAKYPLTSNFASLFIRGELEQGISKLSKILDCRGNYPCR